jgi:hypothetical protein
MAAEQRGTAFGIAIDAAFPIPELPTSKRAPEYPSSHLRLVTAREIQRTWPTASVETALRRSLPDGSPIMVVSRHDEAVQVWGPGTDVTS